MIENQPSSNKGIQTKMKARISNRQIFRNDISLGNTDNTHQIKAFWLFSLNGCMRQLFHFLVSKAVAKECAIKNMF